jgi:hypothetical protein
VWKGVGLCWRICGAESCGQSRSKQIGPFVGADLWLCRAGAMGLQMAAMICPLAWSMIRKSVQRFSEKIMLKQ